MKHALLILLTVTSLSAFAQYSSAHQTNIVFQKAPLGFMTSLPPAEPGLVGSFYLYEDFASADIYLKDSTKLSDVPVRFDVKDNAIEVRYNNDIKLLPVSKIMSMTLKRNGGTEEFVNGAFISTVSKLYRDQLLEVIVDGENALLCSTKAHIKPAQRSQNPMLGTNREDDEIVQNKLYVIVNGNDFVTTADGKAAFRKQITELYGADVEPIVKKVNPKNELDLLFLVNELNKKSKS